MSNMVFISYAKEDESYAETLYDFLALNGYNPWMDKKKLLPGQDWDFYINTALRKADFIILLLSNTSVIKQGYVQKEFSRALQYCEERPKSYTYIIPLKIDNCEVPMELSRFQWEMYSAETTFSKVLQSLNEQKGKSEKDKMKRVAIFNNLEFEEIQIKKILGDEKPHFLIDIEYIQFKEINVESLNEFNAIIKYHVIAGLVLNRASYFDMREYRKKQVISGKIPTDPITIGFSKIDWDISFRYSLRLINSSVISLTIFRSSYSGGAHHGYGTTGYNFVLNPLRKIYIAALFTDSKSAVIFIRKKVHEKLLGQLKKNNPLAYTNGDHELFEKLSKEEWKLFGNFYLTESSIVFIFNPYELMLGFADQMAEITFNELSIGLPNDEKLKSTLALLST